MQYEDTLDETKYQKSEIGALKWMNIGDCIANIRSYNIEKIKMLSKINNILNNDYI